MTQREKVVAHVSQVIRALGIKSVRMDDVATSLGMSKRTLYEMFGDKEELLYESILYMMEQRQRYVGEQLKGCNNMLEVLLRGLRFMDDEDSRDLEQRIATNLKKFYPNVFEKIQRAHTERGLANLYYTLDKCLEEGYLDPNIDVELMTRLFFSTSGTLMSDSSIVLPDGISRREALAAIAVNFIRGLASVKGLQLIDEILSREPRPKKLSERRETNNN